MPRIIGSSVRVVEHDGLTIDELVGNVATNEDTMSAAKVVVTTPSSEPWLTLHYDEWICVLKGRCDMRFIGDDGEEEVLTVTAGETAYIASGERFRPEFPEGKTEYVPVCIPAFCPDRCIREEGEEASSVSKGLQKLHEKEKVSTDNDVRKCDSIERLYHMCHKSTWEQCVEDGCAYFPPTFEADGNFVHATAVPLKLVDIGNHYYKEDKEEWVCLELSKSALKSKCGILTKFEAAMPVGETDTNEKWEDLLFPHIYGGIPSCVNDIVTKIFPIERGDDGSFIDIIGLTDAKYY